MQGSVANGDTSILFVFCAYTFGKDREMCLVGVKARLLLLHDIVSPSETRPLPG